MLYAGCGLYALGGADAPQEVCVAEAEELEAAAAEVATAHVEQKSDEVEAIYIPITEDTMKLRSDDLMVDFDLQPEISEFIWHLIHKTHNTYKFLKK